MDVVPLVLGEPGRSLDKGIFVLSAVRNPYRAISAAEHQANDGIPIWWWILASLFRLSGAIVIAAPFIAFAFDTADHNLNAILMDLAGILKALSFCIGLGGVLYVIGNRLANKNGASEYD